MHIQNQQDQWVPPKQSTLTLFKKIIIDFDDTTIKNNSFKELDCPIIRTQVDEFGQADKDVPEQKGQTLYNPLQDDQNELWMSKKQFGHVCRPLVCPSCLIPCVYNYNAKNSNSYDGVQYHSSQVIGIVIKESQVIRCNNIPQKMQWSYQTDTNLEQMHHKLQSRKQQINIKLICECQCGTHLGYYDINKSKYILMNVI